MLYFDAYDLALDGSRAAMDAMDMSGLRVDGHMMACFAMAVAPIRPIRITFSLFGCMSFVLWMVVEGSMA